MFYVTERACVDGMEEAVIELNQARLAEPAAPWWTVAWFNGLVNAQNNHLDEAIADFEKIRSVTEDVFSGTVKVAHGGGTTLTIVLPLPPQREADRHHP